MAYPPPRPTAPSSSSHLSSQEDVIDYLPDYQFWLSDLMMYQNFPAYGNDEQGETGIAMKAYTSEEDQVLIKQYEEKFFQLFTEYAQDNNVQIEEIRWKEEMLLVLCLKHIIPFLTWIRRSTSQIQHVKSLFLNHTDLRPEVRNGLLVILIHTFAAVKAKYFNEDNALKKSTEGTSSSQYLVTEELHEENMVSILQHPTKGLNISFQSIFKIIHDRHQFIAFLKNIILGLIELNLIPKNTRQKLILPTSSEGNIAISSRTAKDPSDENLVTNQEEYLAYLSLNSWLMTELADERNEAKIHVVRKIIQRFCGYWAMHSKTLKFNRFQHAMKLLTSTEVSPSFSSENILFHPAMLPTELTKSQPTESQPLSTLPSVRSAENLQADPVVKKRKLLSPLTLSPTSKPSSPPAKAAISVFRFERMGNHTWHVKHHLLYDLPSFLETMQQSSWPFYSPNLYAIQCQKMQEICSMDNTHHVIENVDHLENMEGWLKKQKVLFRTWSFEEMSQVLKELEQSTSYPSPQLGIAYEYNIRLVICIRRNVQLGLQHDLWSFLYPLDLQEEIKTCSNVGSLFINLFPILTRLLQSQPSQEQKQIMVKYHHRSLDCVPISSTSHTNKINDFQSEVAWKLPALAEISAFQVIGTTSMDSKRFVAKLQHGCMLHDFLLEEY